MSERTAEEQQVVRPLSALHTCSFLLLFSTSCGESVNVQMAPNVSGILWWVFAAEAVKTSKYKEPSSEIGFVETCV